MSYLGSRLRRNVKRGMSGLQSRPYGPSVSHLALGAAALEYTPVLTLVNVPKPPAKRVVRTRVKAVSYPITVHGPALQGPPDWYRAMAGSSLGDDAPTTGSVALTDGTDQWQQSMLSLTQQIADSQAAFAEKDKWIRYVQIAATLSIPLAAAVWKMIFRGGREVY